MVQFPAARMQVAKSAPLTGWASFCLFLSQHCTIVTALPASAFVLPARFIAAHNTNSCCNMQKLKRCLTSAPFVFLTILYSPPSLTNVAGVGPFGLWAFWCVVFSLLRLVRTCAGERFNDVSSVCTPNTVCWELWGYWSWVGEGWTKSMLSFNFKLPAFYFVNCSK